MELRAQFCDAIRKSMDSYNRDVEKGTKDSSTLTSQWKKIEDKYEELNSVVRSGTRM